MTKTMTKGISIESISKWILFIVLYVALFITFLFSSVQAVVYFNPYFEWHYKAHDVESTTDMSIETLMEVTDNMMDYLIDRRDTLDMTAIINGEEEEVFGQREKDHMVDVKSLMVAGKKMRDISGILLIVSMLALFFLKKEWLKQWIHKLTLFFISAFVVVLIVGGLFASDFNKYFTMFHKIFFSNDLWLLDPKTDILINMVPEIFFFQTVMLILSVFIIMVIGTILIGRRVEKSL